MLNMNKCQIFESYHSPVHSQITHIEEGSFLVHVLEGGIGKVRPSQGGTSEKFAGVAIGRSATPTVVPFFELKAVPATSPYTVTLSKVLNGSAIRVTHIAANGTRTELDPGTPASQADEYSIAAGVITVHSSKASGTLELSYRYAISLQEAIYRYNFNMLGTSNVADIETQGMLTTGTVYTDCYDVTSDWGTWSGTAPVYLTAGGIVTLTSSGNTELDAAVVSVPSASDMFLGLQIKP